MRWILMAVLVLGCAGETTEADEPPASTSEGGEPSEPTAEPEPEAEPVAEPAAEPDPEPLGECHVSCCSERVLEMQAQSDDPSIQNECCFCGD